MPMIVKSLKVYNNSSKVKLYSYRGVKPQEGGESSERGGGKDHHEKGPEDPRSGNPCPAACTPVLLLAVGREETRRSWVSENLGSIF